MTLLSRIDAVLLPLCLFSIGAWLLGLFVPSILPHLAYAVLLSALFSVYAELPQLIHTLQALVCKMSKEIPGDSTSQFPRIDQGGLPLTYHVGKKRREHETETAAVALPTKPRSSSESEVTGSKARYRPGTPSSLRRQIFADRDPLPPQTYSQGFDISLYAYEEPQDVYFKRIHTQACTILCKIHLLRFQGALGFSKWEKAEGQAQNAMKVAVEMSDLELYKKCMNALQAAKSKGRKDDPNHPSYWRKAFISAETMSQKHGYGSSDNEADNNDFNPIKRMKTTAEHESTDKYPYNSGIPQAYRTLPAWTVPEENLDKTHVEIFERQTPAADAVPPPRTVFNGPTGPGNASNASNAQMVRTKPPVRVKLPGQPGSWTHGDRHASTEQVIQQYKAAQKAPARLKKCYLCDSRGLKCNGERPCQNCHEYHVPCDETPRNQHLQHRPCRNCHDQGFLCDERKPCGHCLQGPNAFCVYPDPNNPNLSVAYRVRKPYRLDEPYPGVSNPFEAEGTEHQVKPDLPSPTSEYSGGAPGSASDYSTSPGPSFKTGPNLSDELAKLDMDLVESPDREFAPSLDQEHGGSNVTQSSTDETRPEGAGAIQSTPPNKAQANSNSGGRVQMPPLFVPDRRGEKPQPSLPIFPPLTPGSLAQGMTPEQSARLSEIINEGKRRSEARLSLSRSSSAHAPNENWAKRQSAPTKRFIWDGLQTPLADLRPEILKLRIAERMEDPVMAGWDPRVIENAEREVMELENFRMLHPGQVITEEDFDRWRDREAERESSKRPETSAGPSSLARGRSPEPRRRHTFSPLLGDGTWGPTRVMSPREVIRVENPDPEGSREPKGKSRAAERRDDSVD